MATLGELPPSTSSVSTLPNLNACFDPGDIDAFVNYDQPVYPSPSLSPASSRMKTAVSQQLNINSSSSIPTSASTPSGSSIASNGGRFASNSQSSQLFFSGPSHEYDSYKQQTGLPIGGLANTIAINQANGMNFGLSGQGFTSDGYFSLNRHNEDMIDFASTPVRTFSLRESSEMDLEVDTPSDGYAPFFFPSPTTTKTQFIDPNSLDVPDVPTAGPSSQIGRVYPGMHQQAAMAKAAQQQKQQEIIRRQQQQQRQVDVEQNRQGAKPQNKANRSSDPIVEERISRLLQQMRQSSDVVNEEDKQPANPLPTVTRPKKDEEDMDEDERLLASEEGKKLSSKERRQLRNKVSARAFRSRRKEYISQLEGEVASKTNEANDLRMQNRALMEENARLTDLTRMLLSSPHFSSFLNDISVNGPPAPQPTQPSATQAPLQTRPLKDPNPNRIATDIQMRQDHQVGMAMVPEQGFNFPAVEMNGPGWNSGIDMNFNNTTVFAVLDVPQGPPVDSAIISGKSSNSVGPLPSEDIKDQVPSIERPPTEEVEAEKDPSAIHPNVDIDQSDPSLALFLDQPSGQSRTASPFEDMFGGVEPEKVFARYDLVVEGSSLDEPDAVSASTMSRFERICASMESAFQRVSSFTSYL